MRHVRAGRVLAGLVVSGVVIAHAAIADAGRSPFAWSYGTEVNPVRMVELETWISEENKKGDAKTDKTLIWWGPTIGLTDHLELAIPIELSAESAGGGTPVDTQLLRWGGELRYRFDSPDPVEAGAVTNLARLAVKRAVTERAGVRVEANVVTQVTHGRIVAGVDLALVTEHVPGATSMEFDPGVGIGVCVVDELRLGAEAYGEFEVHGGSEYWASVGPAASFTHGRFWLAATFAIGVAHIRTSPRVKFGISF